LAALACNVGWADVIHGHGHLPACYHAWRRLVGGARPYVFHLHITAAGRRRQAAASGRPLDAWTRYWEWPLHERSDRVGCQVADAVVCTSEQVRREAVALAGADESKTSVLANGVDTERFCPAGPSARERLALAPEQHVVLFVGVLSARKRPELLVQALTHLPAEWVLVFVGRGERRESLEHLAASLAVQDRVRWAGYVPYPELPALYRAADVLALPSRYEGCPKVVLEALACGLGVVAGGFTIEPPSLSQRITWLPDELDERALARATLEAARRCGETVAQEAISWRARARDLQSLYERLVERRKA
jgi:glycosyltransferase involved in cell wall biosynthesis